MCEDRYKKRYPHFSEYFEQRILDVGSRKKACRQVDKIFNEYKNKPCKDYNEKYGNTPGFFDFLQSINRNQCKDLKAAYESYTIPHPKCHHEKYLKFLAEGNFGFAKYLQSVREKASEESICESMEELMNTYKVAMARQRLKRNATFWVLLVVLIVILTFIYLLVKKVIPPLQEKYNMIGGRIYMVPIGVVIAYIAYQNLSSELMKL
jgi:hypothetical protein